MTDHFEPNPDDHEDPAASSTWLVGFIGAVLLIVMMLGVTALYYNVKADRVDVKVVQVDVDEPKDLRDSQERRLTDSAHWEERDDGGEIVRQLVIPIERAMALVAAENVGATSGDMP